MSNLVKPLFSFGNYYFSPTWLPTLVTLLLLPLLISLGFWQLDRAVQKRALQHDYQARSLIKPLNLNQLKELPKDLRFYAAQMTGHFDNTHQFLLDNKIYQHRMGYQVLTPFILKNSNKTILINRGWIAQGSDRAHLPDIKPVVGEVTLNGIVTVPDAKAFTLGHNTENLTWPQRIEKIDLNKMTDKLGYKFFSFIVLLNSKEPYGFVRDWSPFNNNVAVHYGYAFQWFALATTLLIIFIVVNTHRKKIYDIN
jgi:surfeit locus 1 family protein